MYPFYESIQLHVPGRIAQDDAERQERTAREILRRLTERPGLILADEVGMGKTFVALAVAVSTALANRGRRPVVVMTPPALREKWPADFALFTEKCIDAEARRQITYGTADRGRIPKTARRSSATSQERHLCDSRSDEPRIAGPVG